MARMSARSILCVFAPLALLPGCQLPCFSGSAQVESKKTDTVVASKIADSQPNSNHGTQQKVPAVPLPPDARSLDRPFDPVLVKTDEPKKNPAGTAGIIEFEPGTEPSVTQLTPAQAPATLLTQPATVNRKYDQVAQALQDILDGRPQDAVAKLQGYDKATQEFLLNWMPAVVIILRKPIDQMNAQEIAMLNELFSRWSQTIRNYTELVISKMCYCRRIDDFGAYEPLPAEHAFLSGTGRIGDCVQVYVELKNFVSEQVKEGDYVTKLACSLEIKDSRGERVMFERFRREETTHHRRSRLNDLHQNFVFYVPALAPGTYLLTIQVVDETLPNHRRVAQQSLPFRVTPVATDAAAAAALSRMR